MGYAAAMAWVLWIIIFSLSLIALRLSGRFVHYE
jgi:ABC-type sugar transport system permease subunit